MKKIMFIVVALMLQSCSVLMMDEQLHEYTAENETETETSYVLFENMPIVMNIEMDRVCKLKGADIYVAYAILMVENPMLDETATNENSNGTFDCGLFQLNSRYVYTDFIPRYWDLDHECDIMNWRDNMYLAISHIATLCERFENIEDIFAAYNCGRSATINGRVPKFTETVYVPKAINIYNALDINC